MSNEIVQAKPFAVTLDVGSSLLNKTGSWRTERPVYLDRLPPCNHACPAGENIQAWLGYAEEGDYQVKLKNLIKFLTNGDKVKVTLRFRGREMAHQELGLEMLQKVQADLEEFGVVEQEAKLEGRQMVMVVAPKR